MKDDRELQGMLDSVEKAIYYAQIALWAFDFDTANAIITQGIPRLEMYQEDIRKVRGHFLPFGRSKKQEQIDKNRREKARRLIRSGTIDPDFLFASSLKQLSDRASSYLSETQAFKERHLHANDADSGFRFILLPSGDEKFELRAFNQHHVKMPNEEFLLELQYHLRKQGFKEVSTPRFLVLPFEGKGRGKLAKVRIQTDDSVGDFVVMDDDTVAGEILAPNEEAARRIVKSILGALEVS